MTEERPNKRPRTTSPPPIASTSTLPQPQESINNASTSSLPQPSEPILTDEELREIEEKSLEEKWRIYEMIQEEYHDIINELPLDYQRTFILLRELDTEQTSFESSLKQTLTSHLSELSKTPSLSHSTKIAQFQKLKEEIKGAKRTSEDKINLALTLHESVDRHIQRLDSDLALNSDSLLIGLRKGTLPSHDAPQAPLPTDSSSPDHRQQGGGGELGKEKEKEWNKISRISKAEKKKDRKRLVEARGEGELLVPGGVTMAGVPIGEDEDVYCYCQRVAFGEMVACENAECPREWFHLECLGISQAPKGDYYCDECRKLLGMKENEEVKVVVLKKRVRGKGKPKSDKDQDLGDKSKEKEKDKEKEKGGEGTKKRAKKDGEGKKEKDRGEGEEEGKKSSNRDGKDAKEGKEGGKKKKRKSQGSAAEGKSED